jgi:hypothetical protein
MESFKGWLLIPTFAFFFNCGLLQSNYVVSFHEKINKLSRLKLEEKVDSSEYSTKLQLLNGEFSRLKRKLDDNNGKILCNVLSKYIIFLYFFSTDNIENVLKAGSDLIISEVTIDETVYRKQFWYEFNLAAFLDKRVLNNKFFTDYSYKMNYDKDLLESMDRDLENLSLATCGKYENEIFGKFKSEIREIIQAEILVEKTEKDNQ